MTQIYGDNKIYSTTCLAVENIVFIHCDDGNLKIYDKNTKISINFNKNKISEMCPMRCSYTPPLILSIEIEEQKGKILIECQSQFYGHRENGQSYTITCSNGQKINGTRNWDIWETPVTLACIKDDWVATDAKGERIHTDLIISCQGLKLHLIVFFVSIILTFHKKLTQIKIKFHPRQKVLGLSFYGCW